MPYVSRDVLVLHGSSLSLDPWVFAFPAEEKVDALLREYCAASVRGILTAFLCARAWINSLLVARGSQAELGRFGATVESAVIDSFAVVGELLQ